MNELKRLTDLTREDIDADRITNPNLARIIKSCTQRAGAHFVFKFLSRNHRDYKLHTDHTEGNTWPDYDSAGWNHTEHNDHREHTDYDEHSEHSERYEDHRDHTDHTETAHIDEGRYSESEWHSDSDATSHTDREGNVHTDQQR